MITSLLATIAVSASIASCAFYSLCIYGIRRFRRELEDRGITAFTPPVSILKPLCGADPHAYESLRSHCIQSYPEFEIIFGVRDSNDAALGIVQRLIKEFPEREIRVAICPGTFGSNLKINNLIQMVPQARYEYILVND